MLLERARCVKIWSLTIVVYEEGEFCFQGESLSTNSSISGEFKTHGVLSSQNKIRAMVRSYLHIRNGDTAVMNSSPNLGSAIAESVNAQMLNKNLPFGAPMASFKHGQLIWKRPSILPIIVEPYLGQIYWALVENREHQGFR